MSSLNFCKIYVWLPLAAHAIASGCYFCCCYALYLASCWPLVYIYVDDEPPLYPLSIYMHITEASMCMCSLDFHMIYVWWPLAAPAHTHRLRLLFLLLVCPDLASC